MLCACCSRVVKVLIFKSPSLHHHCAGCQKLHQISREVAEFNCYIFRMARQSGQNLGLQQVGSPLHERLLRSRYLRSLFVMSICDVCANVSSGGLYKRACAARACACVDIALMSTLKGGLTYVLIHPCFLTQPTHTIICNTHHHMHLHHRPVRSLNKYQHRCRDHFKEGA